MLVSQQEHFFVVDYVISSTCFCRVGIDIDKSSTRPKCGKKMMQTFAKTMSKTLLWTSVIATDMTIDVTHNAHCHMQDIAIVQEKG